MLTSLTVSMTLLLITANPGIAPPDEVLTPAPNSQTAMILSPTGYRPTGFGGIPSQTTASGAEWGCYDCAGYDDGCCCKRTPCCDWWCPPCTMAQRIEYFPVDHGYYYFRPYHMSHVKIQREIARSWGEDPRNPYDHKVFDRVYASIEADRKAAGQQPESSLKTKPRTPGKTRTTAPIISQLGR
ncbi:MAG: hypothetical protein JSS02_24120 [Planctomycetes bacterium]|nr:hypothetical protein [Planctomycetota bacterium]